MMKIVVVDARREYSVECVSVRCGAFVFLFIDVLANPDAHRHKRSDNANECCHNFEYLKSELAFLKFKLSLPRSCFGAGGMPPFRQTAVPSVSSNRRDGASLPISN